MESDKKFGWKKFLPIFTSVSLTKTDNLQSSIKSNLIENIEANRTIFPPPPLLSKSFKTLNGKVILPWSVVYEKETRESFTPLIMDTEA